MSGARRQTKRSIMYLSITLTRPEPEDARELGYLLHKHPDRHQRFSLSLGQAHVFYPEATPQRATAVLMLELDPVQLSRGKAGASRAQHALEPYVNDRPYVASSFMSVAISKVFASALGGRCPQRPELVQEALDWEIELPVLPARGGEELLKGLFEPLGYEVSAHRLGLDAQHPEWGQGHLWALKLKGQLRLEELLSHLYVLIPVLDDEKHYYIGQDEIEKLLRHGEGWLTQHPLKELITRRYLQRRGGLVQEALALLEDGELDDEDAGDHDQQEEAPLRQPNLHQQRLEQVVAWLERAGAKRVLDLGCGEGKLIAKLLERPQFEQILGVDVSVHTLQIAVRRLRYERMPEHKRSRVELVHGSLIYRDDRLRGFDAAALVEVIEHVEPDRLDALEEAVFAHARPGLVIVTTPNVEYNACFESLSAGAMRHKDHRFEWSRAELQAWAQGVASRRGYQVSFEDIGPVQQPYGAPSQAALFTLSEQALGESQPTTQEEE